MKGLILLADGFEDTEAIATIDLLRRAAIVTDTVSIMKQKEVTSQYNLLVTCEYLYEEINLNDYDFLVIPGGKAVSATHLHSSITKKVVNHFIKKKELVAAICAAPAVLGMYNHLDDLNYTCFPGFETYIQKGINNQKENVVVTGNIITSKACGTVFDFALAIIKYLKGDKVATTVANTIYYK